MSLVPRNDNDNSNEIAEFFQGQIISDFVQNTNENEKLVVVDFEPLAQELFLFPTAGCLQTYVKCSLTGGCD